MRLRRHCNPRRGALVIVIALVTCAVLFVIASSLLLLGKISNQPSIENRHRLQAREALQSAVQDARVYLRDNAADDDGYTSTTSPRRVAIGNACYAYWFGPHTSTAATLHVVAISPYRPPLTNCSWDAQSDGQQKVLATVALDINAEELATVRAVDIAANRQALDIAECPATQPESPSGSGQHPSDVRNAPCYADEVLADNPVLYWRLGDSTATAADASGNGNSGTYTTPDAYDQDQSGATRDGDRGVRFDPAAEGRITRSLAAAPVSSGQTTIEAWVLWDGTETNAMHLFGFATDTLIWTTDGYLGLSTTGTATNVYGVPFAAADWAHHWVHVAMVINNSGATSTKLYLNGQLQPMQQLAGSASGVAIGTSFRVSGSAAEANRSFAGQIDEVAIYAGELSASRIAAHYRAR